MDAEQHKESEREEKMPGREIFVEGRGVVGSEKGRRGGERSENVCRTVQFLCLFACMFVFSPYTCGT